MAVLSFRNITTALRCNVLSFVSYSSCDRCCSNCFLEVVSSQETKEGSRQLQDTCIMPDYLKYKVTETFAPKLVCVQDSLG